MEQSKKPLFEMPKLVGLDGEEITEDRLLEELTAGWNVCLSGGKKCSSGCTAEETKDPSVEEIA